MKPQQRNAVQILVQSIVVSIVFPGYSSAAAEPVECPPFIAQNSIHLQDTPPGWTTFVAAPLYLHGAAPMSGPPEQLGELADFKQEKKSGIWTYKYELDGKFPEGKWLACHYGESNQVTLAKKLADHTRTCAFTYRKGEHVGQNHIAIACK